MARSAAHPWDRPRVKRPLRSCRRHHGRRHRVPAPLPQSSLRSPSGVRTRLWDAPPPQTCALRAPGWGQRSPSGDATQAGPRECRVRGTRSGQGKACPGQGRSGPGNPGPGFKDRMSSPPSLLPNPENEAGEPLGGNPGAGWGDSAFPELGLRQQRATPGRGVSWEEGKSARPPPCRGSGALPQLPADLGSECSRSHASACAHGGHGQAGGGGGGLLPCLQVGMRAAV